MKLADASIIDILQYLSFDRILSAKKILYKFNPIKYIFFLIKNLYLMYMKKAIKTRNPIN